MWLTHGKAWAVARVRGGGERTRERRSRYCLLDTGNGSTARYKASPSDMRHDKVHIGEEEQIGLFCGPS